MNHSDVARHLAYYHHVDGRYPAIFSAGTSSELNLLPWVKNGTHLRIVFADARAVNENVTPISSDETVSLFFIEPVNHSMLTFVC
jgi:hypothetical protein